MRFRPGIRTRKSYTPPCAPVRPVHAARCGAPALPGLAPYRRRPPGWASAPIIEGGWLDGAAPRAGLCPIRGKIGPGPIQGLGRPGAWPRPGASRPDPRHAARPRTSTAGLATASGGCQPPTAARAITWPGGSEGVAFINPSEGGCRGCAWRSQNRGDTPRGGGETPVGKARWALQPSQRRGAPSPAAIAGETRSVQRGVQRGVLKGVLAPSSCQVTRQTAARADRIRGLCSLPSLHACRPQGALGAVPRAFSFAAERAQLETPSPPRRRCTQRSRAQRCHVWRSVRRREQARQARRGAVSRCVWHASWPHGRSGCCSAGGGGEMRRQTNRLRLAPPLTEKVSAGTPATRGTGTPS